MLMLAYCAGLRLGEIVRLNLGDFDTDNGTIEIRLSKFFKSRRLPLAGSVVAALQAYLFTRLESGAPTSPDSAFFWHQQAAGRYSIVRAGSMLTAVLRRAERKPLGRVGPRVHDLRHSFVVNRMLAWYREGVNPQPHLPYLATYLGHRDINSTLVYLTITQELLQLASERFRGRGARSYGRQREETHDANSISSTLACLLSRLAGATAERFSPHRAVLSGQLADVPTVRGFEKGYIRCQAWLE